MMTQHTREQRPWDPWRELRRLVGDGEFPPLNVAREAERIVIETALPGVDRNSLDITATGNTLTIKGERPADTTVPAERWHRRERGTGRFVRSVRIDTRLATDQTKATYRDGILRIEIPLAADAKPQRIQVAS